MMRAWTWQDGATALLESDEYGYKFGQLERSKSYMNRSEDSAQWHTYGQDAYAGAESGPESGDQYAPESQQRMHVDDAIMQTRVHGGWRADYGSVRARDPLPSRGIVYFEVCIQVCFINDDFRKCTHRLICSSSVCCYLVFGSVVTQTRAPHFNAHSRG
jgi:hypothetical protein